jgi:demethylmenaquinone methyltransferase/2-methoxy-6-polyprenyl-1,4-benzoquinol methylase
MAKAEFVNKMFNDIAPKYDLLNDVLSAGTHRLWKKKFIKFALNQNPQTALDCATGTGDIAFKLKESLSGRVVGIDFSSGMIDFANERAKTNPLKVEFKVADIHKLPFADKEFDLTTISFGIRNVEDLGLGLSELGRVSNGVYILEFGQPKNNFYKKAYFNMLKFYVPIFGLISKRKDAYEYLIASSETFPSAEKFVDIMKKNMNFKTYGHIPVFGGIAYIYYAHNGDK